MGGQIPGFCWIALRVKITAEGPDQRAFYFAAGGMTMPYGEQRQEDESLLVLGIDTATLSLQYGKSIEEKLVAEYTLQVKKTHSERLLPFIAAMLKDAGIDLGSLDGVAVAAGPGSLRVCGSA